jgi:hypothetical protein
MKCLGEFIHHLAHAGPIDVIKGPWKYLVSLGEELLGFRSAPIFL